MRLGFMALSTCCAARWVLNDMNTKKKTSIAFLLALMMGITAVMQTAAQHADAAPSPPLRVAVKEIPPFVFDRGTHYTGFSIDIWKEVARRAELEYEFIGVDSVQEQLQAVEQGDADAAIAAISMTSEREQRIDFSQPYFYAGIGIMIRPGHISFAQAFMTALLSPTMRQLLIGFLALLILIAHLIWVVERETNAHFPRNYLAGIWEAFWWATVTITTVGYGDKVPVGKSGRALALFWMLAGIFLIAYLTAAVTSITTVEQLQNDINSIHDINGRRIVTIEGSTSEDLLQEKLIPYQTVTTIQEAFTLLLSEKTDAIISDKAALLYYANREGEGRVEVINELLDREGYAIALPDGSPYQEAIDQAILDIISDGTFDELYVQWFGEMP